MSGEQQLERKKTRGLDEVYIALNKLMSKTKQQLKEAVMTRDQIVKEMMAYVDTLHIDLSSMDVIHVAGTKGKGSTCAFVESILRQHGLTTGLYSSPHLIEVNERIRIGGKPCSEDVFCQHFFSVWDTLSSEAAAAATKTTKSRTGGRMPRYFQFLTLVALKIFSDPAIGVKVVILETGVGGRLDATNIFEHPVVTGITKIGYDHMNVLGSTLDAIASEKAGILKTGSPAFTTASQEPLALKTLVTLAKKAGVKDGEIVICSPLIIDPETKKSVDLGLAGDHQGENAAIALALAHEFLNYWREKTKRVGEEELEDDDDGGGGGGDESGSALCWAGRRYPLFSPSSKLRTALKSTFWPGRCQILELNAAESTPQHQRKLCIDGAHTRDSVNRAANWFAQVVQAEKEKRRSRSRESKKRPPQQHQQKQQQKAAISTMADKIEMKDDEDEEGVNGDSCADIEVGLAFNVGVGRDPGKLLLEINKVLNKAKIHVSWVYSCPFDWDKYSGKNMGSVADICQRHSLPMPSMYGSSSDNKKEEEEEEEKEGTTLKQQQKEELASPSSSSKPTVVRGYQDFSGRWQTVILGIYHAISLKYSNTDCFWSDSSSSSSSTDTNKSTSSSGGGGGGSSRDRCSANHRRSKERNDENSCSSRPKPKKLAVSSDTEKNDEKRRMTELRYFPSAKALVEALKTKAASAAAADETCSQLTLVTGSLYLAGNVLGAVGFQM